MQSKKKKGSRPKIEARSLTVTATYYNASLRNRHNTNIPLIRLRGKWLEEAGFHVGQSINVCIFNQRLVITLKKSV